MLGNVTLIELVERVAEETGVKKDIVAKITKSIFNTIKLSVLHDRDSVSLRGFGRFEVRVFKSRKVFGRVSATRARVVFLPYTVTKKERAMEKRGVVLDDSIVKTGSSGSLCPKCGKKLKEASYCNGCGTEPFEKKPETQKPKK